MKTLGKSKHGFTVDQMGCMVYGELVNTNPELVEERLKKKEEELYKTALRELPEAEARKYADAVFWWVKDKLKEKQKEMRRKMTKTLKKNFKAYLNLDTTNLANKYVIIVNGKVVAKGRGIEEMLKRVTKKYPDEIPFIAKVPSKQMQIMLGFEGVEK